MSAPFAFLPRRVAHPKKPVPKVNSISGEQPTASSSLQKGKGNQITQPPKQAKPAVETEDVVLVWLALSDYALWSDGDLRRRLDQTHSRGHDESSATSESIEDTRGYIPFNYLAKHSSVLAPLRKYVGTSQTPLIKELRSQAPHLFEVQLIVSAPQPWFNHKGSTASSSSAPGGYEIRRRNWAESSNLGYTKSDWDKRTLYVEHVPIEYRSTASLVKFLLSLLPQDSAVDASPLQGLQRIQNVTLPPHHQDHTDAPPAFKGFALVTFLALDDMEHVMRMFPWECPPGQRDIAAATSEHQQGALDKAVKFGLRTLPKAQWEKLREEYIAYRQNLVAKIAEFQDAQSLPLDAPDLPPAPVDERLVEQKHKPSLRAAADLPGASGDPLITPNSPFPYGCLVFVKHINTGTNKTTLKNFFGAVLALPGSKPAGPDVGLDYVDFNKGMDTCHLRLSTPAHAAKLHSHFKACTLVQVDGLDDKGSLVSEAAGKNLKPVEVEIVRGAREEMYWQKVPEKIRRGAVDKALQLAGGSQDHVERVLEDEEPQKKRRKTRR